MLCINSPWKVRKLYVLGWEGWSNRECGKWWKKWEGSWREHKGTSVCPQGTTSYPCPSWHIFLMTPLDSNIPCKPDLQDLWLLSLFSAPFLLSSAQNGISRSRLPTCSQLTEGVCQQQLHTLHRHAFLLSYWQREKLMFCPWTAKALLSEIYNIPLIIWTWKAVL